MLIRETALRAGLGWRGIVLLAAAAGVLQAGVVDQSLFSVSYRGIESWEASRLGTLIEPLGVSAPMAQLFVAGHVIHSFGAPIALVEAFAASYRREPWLGPVGLAVMAMTRASGVRTALTVAESAIVTQCNGDRPRYKLRAGRAGRAGGRACVLTCTKRGATVRHASIQSESP